MAQDPAGTELMTKRTLVAVSHAIERAALAAADDGPLVMIGLFQRLPYFERERAVYERIAALGGVTVVGWVGEVPEGLARSPRIATVALQEGERLAREWTVVLLTPRMGATLVAYDREEALADETLEAGRLFDSVWGYQRAEAHAQARRLRQQLGDRLPAAARQGIDEALLRVGGTEADPVEGRTEASVRLLASRVEREQRRVGSLRERLEVLEGTHRDDATGLPDHRFLDRWTGGLTSSGSVPVTLALVRVPLAALSAPGSSHVRRHVVRLERAVATALEGVVQDGDRLVRLGPDDFLVASPGDDLGRAEALAGRAVQAIEGIDPRLRLVDLAPRAAVTTTRSRPLPLVQLASALEAPAEDGAGSLARSVVVVDLAARQAPVGPAAASA